LADNVTQGLAQGDISAPTPLWGIGQRLFFLHDGRTSDLLAAIKAHASTSGDDDKARDRARLAMTVTTIRLLKPRCDSQIHALPTTDKQAILDFLRSL